MPCVPVDCHTAESRNCPVDETARSADGDMNSKSMWRLHDGVAHLSALSSSLALELEATGTYVCKQYAYAMVKEACVLLPLF